MKIITNDRVSNFHDHQNLLKVTAMRFMLAIVSSVVGLAAIGFAMITSIINETLAVLICVIMSIVIAWFILQYIKQAKI